ncbi:MAG: hypothetical protein R3B47_18495 [Bacteroidia bacterium]
MLGTSMSAQERLWIMLTDKGPEATQLLEQPETFLSEAALAQAENGIAVSEKTICRFMQYINRFRQAAPGVLGTSRWLNAVAVEVHDDQLKRIDKLCFVANSRRLQTLKSAAYHNADEQPLPSRVRQWLVRKTFRSSMAMPPCKTPC